MCEAALSVVMRMLKPRKKETEKDAGEKVVSLSSLSFSSLLLYLSFLPRFHSCPFLPNSLCVFRSYQLLGAYVQLGSYPSEQSIISYWEPVYS